MGNPEPEWVQKAAAHNARTILKLSRFAQPLIIFGVLYWLLDNGTEFSKESVVILSILAAVVDWLFLTWILKKINHKKDNTIG